MMSIPFFGIAFSLIATLAGKRSLALVLWAVSMVVLLGLFKLHATDPLDIAL